MAIRSLKSKRPGKSRISKSGGIRATSGVFFQQSQRVNFFSGQSESSTTFFQPALTTGQPGDKFEREADAVADKVTGNQPTGNIGQQPAISAVQKADLKEEEKKVQKASEKEEEEPVQKAEEKKEEEKPVQKVEEGKEEETPLQKAREREEEEPVQKSEEKEEK